MINRMKGMGSPLISVKCRTLNRRNNLRKAHLPERAITTRSAMIFCWKGALALVLGIILGAAAAFELPGSVSGSVPGSETVAVALASAAGVLIIISIYWFTRPPCESEEGE